MALPVSLNSSITAYNFPIFSCFSSSVTANGRYAKANNYIDGPQGLAGTDYANGRPQDGQSMIIFYSAGGAPPPYNVWYINHYCDNNNIYAYNPSTDAANIPETGWRLGSPGSPGEVIPLVLSGIRASSVTEISVCNLNNAAGGNPNGVYTLANGVSGKDSWERTVGSTTFSLQYFESLPTTFEWHIIDKAVPGTFVAIGGASDNRLPWQTIWVNNGYGVATVTASNSGCAVDPYAPWGGFNNWRRLRLLEYV
jgi:hypothetical protein